MSAVSVSPAIHLARPSGASLDRALGMLVGFMLIVLFTSPTRFMYEPIRYDGDYVSFIPFNYIDLIWLSTGVVLYLRAGRLRASALLGFTAIIVIGALVLRADDALTYEKVNDLLLFNVRLFGGITMGWILAQGFMSPATLGSIFVVGAVILSFSSFVLLQGGVSYDLYSVDRRFGAMGLSANEAGIVFASAFNMIPGIFRKAKWTALGAPFLVSALMLTGSRTAFLLAIPGVFLWLPVLRRVFKGRTAVFAWLAFGVAALVLIWFQYRLALSFMRTGLVAPTTDRLGNVSDVSTVGRIELYIRVPLHLWTHPLTLIFGAGGSNVATEAFLQNVLFNWTYHTHNLLLQFLVMYGVAGFILFVAILVPQVRWSSRFPDDAARGVRVFALSMTAGQLVQYGLMEEKFLLIYALVAGYVAAISARPLVPRAA